MKRILIILPVLLLTSCAALYQQIASISSPQIRLSDDGHFAYSEDDIIVDYDFWAENGRVSFILTNNLDSDVYVDLGRSFLVVNGMTFDYYQNRKYSTNSSNTFVSSSAYSTSNTFAAASVRTNAFASRTTSTSTINYGVEYAEKEGVWIPAHSSRYFCEFSLLEVPYRKCGFARNPSKKEDITLTFNEENSPYVFDNILMLVVNGAERRVVNSFYISRLTNILKEQTYKDEYDQNCDGSKIELVRNYKFRSANRFFVDYNFNYDTGTDRLKKTSHPRTLPQ